jgi:hypothetical protein
VLNLGRGRSFDHKKKNHPGKFPKNSEVKTHSEDPPGDEEFIVVREAFKNRVETEE